MKNTDKALNGHIVFVQRLSLQLCYKGRLLEDGGIKNVALSARESGRKDTMKSLTVERAWTGRRGVG